MALTSQVQLPESLHHGGRLREASARWNIPEADWLDLSTGINPNPWPAPPIAAASWHRLPENDDGLHEAARNYYGSDYLLPVAGSQAAIRALPMLRSPSRVAILSPTYGEHAAAWRLAGHQVIELPNGALTDDGIDRRFLDNSDACDVVVLANPNNPTGHRHEPVALLGLARSLAARGAWLVVDEAFIDPRSDASLAPSAGIPGLVVLRSFGKFFGLAGARVGFVGAWPELLGQLSVFLGPWTISTPSRLLAREALRDIDWQDATRRHLPQDASRLSALLAQHGLAPAGGCELFQWVRTESAPAIQEALARLGILVRCFDEPAALRFGLPGRESDWQRLEAGLRVAIAHHAPVEFSR